MHPSSKPGPSNIRGKVDERFITFRKQVVPAATEEELPESATAVTDKHEMYHVKRAKKGEEVVCFPKDYEEVDESICLQRRKKTTKPSKVKLPNPYCKRAFMYEMSDDSDFE